MSHPLPNPEQRPCGLVTQEQTQEQAVLYSASPSSPHSTSSVSKDLSTHSAHSNQQYASIRYLDSPLISAHTFSAMGENRASMLPARSSLSQRHSEPQALVDPLLEALPNLSAEKQVSSHNMVFATSPASSRFEPKHSRLPSNSVGRKVPRKSSTVSNPPIKKTPKARASTPRKPESAGTLKGRRPSTGLSNEKPRNDVSRFQKSRLVTGRSFKLEESIAQDIGKSYVPRRGTIKQESPESGSSSPLVAPPNTQADPSIQTQTASQQQACSRETCHRRRLRNDYMVPPELEGVERALGSENWIDYLMLAKKRVLNEITEAEYHAATRRLFYVINSKLREQIQAEVIKSMVELVTGGSIFSTECKCVQVKAMEETS